MVGQHACLQLWVGRMGRGGGAHVRQPVPVRTSGWHCLPGCCRELLGSVEERFGALERCPDPRGEVAKNYRVRAAGWGGICCTIAVTSAGRHSAM